MLSDLTHADFEDVGKVLDAMEDDLQALADDIRVLAVCPADTLIHDLTKAHDRAHALRILISKALDRLHNTEE